jgi:hypothetical protein
VKERHKFLLSRLAGHHRFVTARQVALLLALPESQAARELERLRLRGWLGRFMTWEAPPAGEFALAGPLAVRERDGPTPDLREVARRAAARRLRPTRRVWAYHATRWALNLVDYIRRALPGPVGVPAAVAMTYDWLQCNRPFLSSPTQAWKSVLLLQCQMKMEEQTSDLGRFRDALERFARTLPEPKRGRASAVAAQHLFEFGLEMDPSTRKAECVEFGEIERLSERVQLLQEACQ